MKNFITSLLIAITLVLLSSFDSAKEQIVLTVSAGIEATFDLYVNGKTIHNIKTPYTFYAEQKDCRIILKSLDETSLTVEAKNNDRSMLKSQWKTIVVTIDDGKMTTFGMD